MSVSNFEEDQYPKAVRATPRPQDNSVAEKTYAGNMGTRAETLTERLERELRDDSNVMSQKHRILQLLRQHPEFEAYQEL